MNICENIYQKIIDCCSANSNETGGIIGGKNGVVGEFVFDESLDNGESGCYYPDTILLNRYLSDWQQRGIDFYGIVHSHFQKSYELSSGDKEYINSIMMVMPTGTNHLYFPLVFPNEKKMVSFSATRIGGMTKIICDEINIV